MDPSRKELLLDPDYELKVFIPDRMRQREERDDKNQLEKATEIIKREFQIELDYRQSQLELIQQRLNEAQKTLHLLRYVLVNSYYTENEKALKELEEVHPDLMVNSKGRLHPAIKKLLGNDKKPYDLHFSASPRKKKHIYCSKETKESPKQQETTIKSEISEIQPEGEDHSKIDSENKDLKDFDTARNRKKSNYRIVVGNISKWIPSHSDEDKSTHKWMVYVRGSKENPDISHFVQKVVFYLHPSYQPNDVIEIRDGPFHLTRRGWGEFPLRVRIYFKCSLNKPVDIIHTLKLDKTFTGRQTLGNETIVNLLLYNEEEEESSDVSSQNLQNNYSELDANVIIKTEPIEFEYHELQPLDYKPELSKYEHNYCCENENAFKVKRELEIEDSQPSTSQNIHDHLWEHSYFNNPEIKDNSEDIIYGIKEEKQDVIEEVVLEDVRIPARRNFPYQKLIMSNGTVFAIRKRRRPQESLLKKIFHKKFASEAAVLSTSNGENGIHLKQDHCSVDTKEYEICFPRRKFLTVAEALPYLLKRLPIVSNLASNTNYKCTYPFTASSVEEYSSWTLGRRLSSEWFQAKTILNILSSSDVADYKQWTPKSIIMYARAHGYTPLANYEIFKGKSKPETMTNGVLKNRQIISNRMISKPSELPGAADEEMIDVTGFSAATSDLLLPKEELVDSELILPLSYVKNSVLDVGLILKSEEIIPEVMYNAAERIILSVTLHLAEDIIRRARASLVYNGTFSEETSTIELSDIQAVLKETLQFQLFNNVTQ